MNTAQEAFRAFVTVITAVAAAICCGFIVKHVALAFDTTMLPTFFITAAIILGGMLLYFAVPWGTLFTKKRKSWSIPVSQRGTNHGWVSMPGQQGVYPTLAAQAAPTQPGVQAAPAGPSKTLAFFKEQGWLLAGFLFAAISLLCAFKAYGAEDPIPTWVACGVCVLASVSCFLVYAGSLEKALVATAKDYKSAVWLTLSVIAVGFSYLHADREGYSLWSSLSFYLSLVSAFLALLGTVGLLGSFMKAVGNGLAAGYSGKAGRWVQLFMVATTIALIGVAIYTFGKMETFEDIDNIGKWTELGSVAVFASLFLGGFIVLFGLLCKKISV